MTPAWKTENIQWLKRYIVGDSGGLKMSLAAEAAFLLFTFAGRLFLIFLPKVPF